MIREGMAQVGNNGGLKLEAGYRTSIIRLKMVQEAESLYGMKRFESPGAAARAMSPLVEDTDRELFLVMSLNAALQPIAVEVVAVGGIDSCYVDMRNVFKHALLCNASGIICFHNHPSGRIEPSREDRALTKRICRVARFMDLKLHDHIILGRDGKFFSFQEEDALEDGGDCGVA